MSSSVLSSISKFKSPILTIMMLIAFYIIKMELQSSAFDKRKIFSGGMPKIRGLMYKRVIVCISLIIIAFGISMLFCINNKKFWVIGVVLLSFNIFLVMFLYSMFSYPDFYKRDKFPAYTNSSGQKFIILDIFGKKAQVVKLNPSNFDKLTNGKVIFTKLKYNNKRYIINIDKIINNYGVYYIDNVKHSSHNI